MIHTYNQYLAEARSMPIEQMEKLHMLLVEEISTDADALELYDETIEIATRYAEIRAQWLLMSREERRDKDSLRTSCHDAVIIHFNMLARYLKTRGKPAIWRDELGDENADGYNRKAIGDFACYLVFINSINAR